MPQASPTMGFGSRLGVRARSTIAAVLVVALALAVGGVALVLVLKVSLTSTVEQSVQQRASDVAAQIADEDIEAATPTINAAHGDNTLIQIVDASGRVVASSSSITGEAPITTAVASVEPQSSVIPVPFVDNAPYLVTTISARAKDEVVTVIAAQSLVQVQRVYDMVTLLLLVGSPFLLLAVGGVTWFAVGRGLASVDRIRLRVESIGGRHLDERVPVPAAKDEIRSLAVTMNHMLDRMEQSATSQRQFVADASHELKSPLASMRASLDVARSAGGVESWPEVEPVLSDEVDRMTRLVADLLLLAKADEGALALQPTGVDLDELLSDEARRVRAQTELTVVTRIEPVQIVADPGRLAQAVRNIVDNGTRFARAQVRLSVAWHGTDAVITIEDDGPGIPAESQEAVMRRFVRLDAHRARNHGGTGLGLPITAEIVRLHGGTVVISGSELGGAQVSLVLPIVFSTPPTASSL